MGTAYWHGLECDRECRDLAVPSPYVRDRAPMVACPHCGAHPGVACHVVGARRKRVLPLVVFGRNHPSRLEPAS